MTSRSMTLWPWLTFQLKKNIFKLDFVGAGGIHVLQTHFVFKNYLICLKTVTFQFCWEGNLFLQFFQCQNLSATCIIMVTCFNHIMPVIEFLKIRTKVCRLYHVMKGNINMKLIWNWIERCKINNDRMIHVHVLVLFITFALNIMIILNIW